MICAHAYRGLRLICDIIQVFMISFIREIERYETNQCNNNPGNDTTADEGPAPAFLEKIQKKQVQQW